MKDRDAGFTLIELMVVVVIIGLLALIAIPSLSRDTAKSNYDQFSNEVYQTFQRAKMEAISSREARRVRFGTTNSYSLESTGSTVALLRQVTVRDGLAVQDAKCKTGSFAVPPFEIHFSAVGDVAYCAGASCTPAVCSVIIRLTSSDNRYQGRIEVSQATGYARLYEGY